MVGLVAAGLFALLQIVIEVFPEFSLDAVQITVTYPGATPEEVEESIVEKIEEQVESVEGVKEIRATAAEGVANVTVELNRTVNVGRALDDIKSQIDQIQTFPAEAEEPEVRELTNRQSVMRIAIYGDAEERALKEIAYRAEEELSQLSAVSYVQTSAIRNYEVSIEVSERALRAYGLSLPLVAQRVRQSSLDLSAGSVETSEEEVRVRTLGQNYTQQEFEDIVLVASTDGATVRLGDIATVEDAFADTDLVTRYNGQPAAFVEVYRTSDERVLDVTGAVDDYLENDLAPSLPRGVEYEVWENDAEILRDRIRLLLKNAAIGLALVFLALTLFLNLRLAFWVAVGLGVSFVGTLAVMQWLGVSINQISLFGFILAIGIVVDDAIVIGENVYAERERGLSGVDAAVKGATRIAVPVVFAVLTTMVAFSPLLSVPGTIGKILGVIPVVVIAVLSLSLIESLFVLPHHLSSLPDPDEEGNRVERFFNTLQAWVDDKLSRFINGPLDTALRFATSAPSVVVAAAVGLLALAVATVPAGLVRVQFFPSVEADIVTAQVEMPQGTVAAQTREVAERVRAAGVAVADSLRQQQGGDGEDGEGQGGGEDLLEATYLTVGSLPAEGGPEGAGFSRIQPNRAAVQIKLLDAQQRSVSSKAFETAWRERVGQVPEAQSLSFSSSLVSVGSPVNVELSHPDEEVLAQVSDRVAEQAAQIGGVFDVQTDLNQGTRELQLELKPEARTLGLTLEDVAGQVRAAFFGQEALRVQRGREDVRVYVRLPERERDAVADVLDYRVILPQGVAAGSVGGPGTGAGAVAGTPVSGAVPLRQVADVRFGTSPSAIQREGGRRAVTITADVDPAVISGGEATGQIEDEIIPSFQEEYPQLTYEVGGEQEEQAESFGALGRGFLLALFGIYALLAIPFRSYLQPLVIMAAIPFGVVGAIAGHLLLGLSIGILSLFGIIGLSGVVVNDSLVMVDFINAERLSGKGLRESVIAGAKARFRPILLTSLTTFLGVAPLVFEQSLQAQFLIPMAASLAFGILFATFILMLLVPALSMLQFRGQRAFETAFLGHDEDDVDVVHASQQPPEAVDDAGGARGGGSADDAQPGGDGADRQAQTA
jgi:multidrug efflux pump subunit AcrB